MEDNKEMKEAIQEIFKDIEIADLYKKQRPKYWRDIIGQDAVVESLKRAIRSNDIASAYGFFGPPGCGKTSAGLIFAKAINCENLQDDCEPCQVCDTCVSIENETSFGFNYFSMANDGSVDNVRNILERAQMKQPVKRQIWILDEIHNLHDKAYDALLIPIEKKQDRAVFIFCSTDQHKIKDTVLQRIQTKNFSKVPEKTLMPYCGKVLLSAGVPKDVLIANKPILEKISKASIKLGNGHVRKTLSYLEEIITTGIVPSEENKELIRSLYSLSIVKVFKELSRLITEESQDILDISREIHEYLTKDLRNLDNKEISQKIINCFGSLENFVDFIGRHGEAVDKACFSIEQKTVYESYLSLAMLKAKDVKRKIEAVSRKQKDS